MRPHLRLLAAVLALAAPVRASLEPRPELDVGPQRFAVAAADALAFSDDGARVLAFTPAGPRAFDAATGHPQTLAPPPAPPPRVPSFPLRVQSPDGALVLTQPVGLNPEVREATGRIVGALPLPWARARRPDALRLAAFSPRADRVAGVASRGRLAIWSLPDARLLRTTRLGREARHLAWSPDGERLAIAGHTQLDVLDAATLTPRWSSREHEPASALAWSPDGRRIALGPCRGRLHVFDAATGAEPVPAGRPVVAAAWFPDGRALLALDDEDRITAWRLDTALARWSVHLRRPAAGACAADARAALACAPAGDLVAVSTGDGVRVLDAATGQQRARLARASAIPGPVAFSRQGLLALGAESEEDAIGGPASVLAFDADLRLRHRLRASPARFTAFAVDPSGALIAGGRLSPPEQERLELDRWDLSSARPLPPFKPPLDGGPFDISTDNEWMVSARPGTIHRVRLSDETTVREALDDTVLPTAVAASAGADLIAVASADGRLLVGSLSFRLPAPPAWLAFSPDARRIAVVAAGRLLVLDVSSARPMPPAPPVSAREMEPPPLHHPGLRALAIAGSPPRIASTGDDGAVRVWSAATAAPELEIPVAGPAPAVALSPDARWLAVAQSDTPALYDLHTGRLRLRGERAGAALQAIAVSPDGACVAAALQGGALAVWNEAGAIAARTPATTAALEAPLLTVALPAPDRVIAVHEDGRAAVWPAALDRPIAAHRWPDRIQSAFHDARRVVGVTGGGEAIALDPTTGATARMFWPLHASRLAPASPPFIRGLAPCAAPDASRRLDRDPRGPRVALAPDGDHLAVGAGNGQIRVVSLRRSRTLHPIAPDPEPSGRVALSADGRRVAEASAVGSWRVWDAATGRLLRWGAAEASPRHDRDAAVALSRDGRLLALGRPGAVRLIDVESGACRTVQLPASAGRRAPAGLAFSASGRQLACLLPPAGLIVEVASRTVASTLAPIAHPIVRARFTTDGRRLLGAGPRAACAWDAATGRALWTSADPDRVPGRGLHSALSERHVVRLRGALLEHLDPATGRVQRSSPHRGPSPDETPFEASADGARLVAVDGERLHVQDEGLDPSRIRLPGGTSPAIALSADGTVIATRRGHRVRVYLTAGRAGNR